MLRSKKILLLITALLFLVILSSCSDTKAMENKYGQLLEETAASPSPSAAEEDANTLTFACYGFDSVTNFWINHANAYMAEHPGVNIQIDILGNALGDNSILSTRLMAGEAADVLEFYPEHHFLQSGNFLDLRSYVDSTPDFNDDNYFMNVIDAMNDGSGLFAIPYSFNMTNIYAMRKDLNPEAASWFESAEQITFADMVSLYEKIGVPEGLYFYEHFSPVDAVDFYASSCVNLKNNTCDFKNTSLLDILERTQNIPVTDSVKITEDNMVYLSRSDITRYPGMTASPGKFMFIRCDGIYYPEMYFPYEDSLYTKPRIILSGDGSFAFDPLECLAISNSCKNPDLAWDFICFCLSDHTEAYDFGDQPTIPEFAYSSTVGSAPSVNRTNFHIQCELFAAGRYDLTQDAYDAVPAGTREQVIADTASILRQLPENCNICSMTYYEISSVIWPEKYLYITGLDTAEEMLNKINSKVELYLNE